MLAIQLYAHSDYSLFESVLTVEALVAEAVKLGIKVLALTDHNTTAGHVEFEYHCKKAGIKPIFGLELDVFDSVSKEISSLVILAQTAQGYSNLLRLASQNPPISRDILPQYSEGLALLEGGMGGQLTKLVQSEEFVQANELLEWYGKNFGTQFYLRHELGQDQSLFERFPEQKFILCQDIRYADPATLPALELLNTIKGELQREIPPIFPMLCWEELCRRFVGPRSAIAITQELAQICQVRLPKESFLLPHPTEKGLDEQVWEGARKRYGSITQEIERRLSYELESIKNLGYDDYFLIVADIVRFAKNARIPVGPGRGSAASSLVAYVLEITDVDPLQFGLIFERFLNPERKTRPDIDLDFCYERREEVLSYVAERFGRDHVAQIGTYGTFGERSAEQEVKRVLGKDDRQIAAQIQGLKRHRSIHAAGVVLTAKPTQTYSAVYNDRELPVTHLDMYSLEKLGVLKIDLLGLRTLTLLKHIEAEIQKREPEFSLEGIPLEDERTFQLLGQGRSLGIFQLESSLFQELLRTLKPTSFKDLVALLALGRPGPLSIFPEYVRRRNHPEQVRQVHPQLEDILAESYGLILYQEQILLIGQKLAGLSLGEADLFRSALGKKDPQAIALWKERFKAGVQNKTGLSDSEVERIFKVIQQFSGYAFNKAHSVSYAFLTWRSSFLKANYPREFFLTLLNEGGGGKEHRQYLLECQALGVEILAPSVLHSKPQITLEGSKLRLGLTTNHKISPYSADLILQGRQRGFGKGFAYFQKQIKLDERTLEILIFSGAFDELGARNAHLKALGQSPRGRLDLLRLERDNLGIYVSEHPSTPFLSLMRHLKGELDVIVGEVLEIKKIGAKVQGILDTPKGSSFFQGTLDLPGSSILPGTSLALFGILDNGSWQVQWSFPLGPVLVPSPAPQNLEIMKATFLAHRGNTPVVLRLGEGTAYHLLPREFWVQDPENVKKILSEQGIATYIFDPWKEKS